MPELQRDTKRKPDEFKKSFGLSLAIHGLVFSLFFIKLVFFSEPMLDLSQAISVNVGDFKESTKMPAKAVEPAEEAPAPPAPEPETVKEEKPAPPVKAPVKEKAKPEKPEAVNLNKTKAKQKEALSKLKKLSAIEKIKQDLKNESKSKSTNKTPAKPRIIAAGSALGGLDRLQADTYLQAVDGGIKQHWALPQWLINKPLKAKILVKIDMQGQIISAQVVSPSGNASYDQYCLGAVQKAAPFPAVPEKLSEKFSVDGILVGFPE